MLGGGAAMIELLIVAALSMPQDTRTTCQPNAAGQVVCDTKGPQRGPDMSCAGGDWLIAGCSYGAHREAREAREAQQRAATARDRAMALLRQDDCRGAVNAALDTGDLRFATEVRAFCATPALPATTPNQ